MQKTPRYKRNTKRMRKHRANHSTTQMIACVMVLCTVCAMSFPAFATNSVCNLDHVHDASCNVGQTGKSIRNLTGAVLHSHNEFCLDSSGNVICPLTELKEHKHSDECYEILVQETEPAKPAHVHGDSCYEMEKGSLICEVTEQVIHIHSVDCYESVAQEEPGHEHTDACYTQEKGDLTCELPEQEGHTHGEFCYSVELICNTEENEEHAHADPCYSKELVCGRPEEAGHGHGDDCYAWNEILSCDLQESAEAVETEKVLVCTKKVKTLYIHKDSCYSYDLVCDRKEIGGHTHTKEDCYVKNLVCGYPASCEHVHQKDCYEWTQNLVCDIEELPTEEAGQTEPPKTEKVLICTKNELINHSHTASCYGADAAGAEQIICGQIQLEKHQHTEDCLGFSASKLLCSLEETEGHKHNFRCYSSWSFRCQETEDDTTEEPTEEPATEPGRTPVKKPECADWETREEWEATFAHVKRTGAWPHDVLAIAQTQLGYRESLEDYIMSGSTQKGYTRYGAWCSDEYGDWCAMFVAFCLRYAGVLDYPTHMNCAAWIRLLEEIDMYVPAELYAPKPGDIIFFDVNRTAETPDETAPRVNHVGLVTKVIPATEDEQAKICTIEGNNQNSVREIVYDAADPRIIGYGLLPDSPAAIYSCGMEKHVHDARCYGYENGVICQIQDHIHNEICRSRNLQYADDSMMVNVTLTNAVYLPEELSLHIELVSEKEKRASKNMIASIGDRLLKSSCSLEDVMFYRMELRANGKPCQQLLGVQADVQIFFTQAVPVTTGMNVTVNPETYMLIAAEAAPEQNPNKRTADSTILLPETESYRAEKVVAEDYEVADDGILRVFFIADQVSDFVIILGDGA